MDIYAWLSAYTAAVRQEFGERVRFVGLQGSRARGEARADSDIDVVLLLDEWRAADWARYEAVLDSLPARDAAFAARSDELLAWAAALIRTYP